MNVSNYRKIHRLVGLPERLDLLMYLDAHPDTSPSMYRDALLLESSGSKIRPPSLSMLAYHFRELKKNKLIEQTNHAQRRGAVEHFYSLTDAGKELVSLLVSTD